VAGQSAFSLCPVCLKRIPAAHATEGDTVYLSKECDQHGSFRTAVWKGAPDMAQWCANSEQSEDNAACPELCGLCDSHLRKTCCAILNVTEQCNLSCPYCFEGDSSGHEPALDYIKSSLRDMASKGITFVHLSGGEPTLRDDIPEIAAYAVSLGFEYIQLNTNGLRLAEDESYVRELARAGISTVFLQFDGTDDRVFSALRGAPLFSRKCRAIENCGSAFLGVVLVPTIVPHINGMEIGNIVRFATGHIPFVKGVHFQPVTYVGRFPAAPDDSSRITLPEILVAIEEQTNGQVRAGQFSPSGCDHPMCGFHGEFVCGEDGLEPLFRARSKERCCGSGIPVSKAEAVRKSQNFVRFRWTRTRSHDLSAAGSSIDGFLNKVQTNGFSISGMAFQDEFNVELARLRHCSVHTYDEGRLIPFCARNIYHKQHAFRTALNK
jgi:7,8-dihydro-6-hydroxymethylpterin dimethyltransferase